MRWLLLAVGMAWTSAPAAEAPRYQLRLLHPFLQEAPGGASPSHCSALDMSGEGTILSRCTNGTLFNWQGLLVSGASGTRPLSEILGFESIAGDPRSVGTWQTRETHVNAAGEIAGCAFRASTHYDEDERPFFYSPVTGFQWIPTPYEGCATAINDLGQVAGIYRRTSRDRWFGFLWSREGGLRTIPPFNGDKRSIPFPYALTNHGTWVGVDQHCFALADCQAISGTFTDPTPRAISLPGPERLIAPFAANESGTVAGTCSRGNRFFACAWSEAEGKLVAFSDGNQQGQVNDLNQGGDMVG
jgi:hypothetical protein